MKVVVIKLTPFNTETLEGVTSITYDGANYSIVAGGVTHTYGVNDYKLSILF